MNKKIILIFLILVSMVAVSHACAADASEIETQIDDADDSAVNLDDNEVCQAIDDGVCKLDSNYHGSIQEMIDQAQEGDTINLTGTYYMDYPININKSVNLNGVDGGAILKINESIDFKFPFIYVNYTAPNVSLNNLKFIGSNSLWGGAVFWEGDYGTITNCEFKDNGADGNYGLAGGVFAQGNNLTIINSTFDHNIASTYGGALIVAGNGAVITNCTFRENQARGDTDKDKGGAIAILGTYCNITGCTFEKNQVNKYGGAIYWMGNDGALSNCEFKENYGLKNGSLAGALLISANNCLVVNCNFTNNYCYDCGGAIFLTENRANRIIGCKFEGNYVLNPYVSQEGGGAIYSSCIDCIIDGCTFKGNNALKSCGGAVLIVNENNTIKNSFFEANTAMRNGGNDIFDAASSNVTSNYFVIDFDEEIKDAIKGISEEELRKAGNTFEKIKHNSAVTFETGLIFEYGRSGSISVIVDGGYIELKNIRVLNHPEAKISYSNNVLTVSNLAVGTYTLRVTTTPDDRHNAVDSDLTVIVKKATAVIKAYKVTVAYKKSTKWSITIVNSRTKEPISNLKVTLKVYTGKKFKTVTVKTNSKGVATYQTKKLAVGNHKIVVSAKDSRYNFNTLTSSVKVVKQTALKITAKKKKVKDGASVSIKVIDKKTKKPVNGVKIKLLIYTGKKYKTITLKSKKVGKKIGVCGYATNKLSVGTHKVKVMPANIKYSGSASSSMKITKKDKKAPAWETKQ